MSAADPVRLRQSVEAAIATIPEFNASCVHGEGTDRYRISGFEQIGDILLTVEVTDLSNSVRIDHRRGDADRLAKLVDRLAGELSSCGQPRVPRGLAERSLSQFIHAFGRKCRHFRSIFADASLESALECSFSEHHKVLEECAKLLEARVLITQGKTNRPRHKAMVERITRTYHDKHVRTVYHGGRKHVLCHRVEIASAHTPLTLRMHYAWDKTAQRYVIGWFDEFSQCPF
jgi:hypothetical protein